MPEITAGDWENYLSTQPDAHILQTREWGELKARFGWEAIRILAQQPLSGQKKVPGVQILFRPLPMGLSLAYIPKGPVNFSHPTNENEPAWRNLWSEVDSACRRRRAIFLKVEPDQLASEDSDKEAREKPLPPPPAGFRTSPHSIQPLRTILVDIRGEESEILKRMKQKTRYNIRLAQKKGVTVTSSADLEAFHSLMLDTGNRDHFGVHSREYYHCVYSLFHSQGQCELLQATFMGKPIAVLMVFAHGPRAWYFFGGSANLHRELMPSYLLQWEAIRWARSRGCSYYDLWGVPDYDLETLETGFTSHSDGLWGVYRFKRGYGGVLRRSIGPWDRVYSPMLYALYIAWLRVKARQPELVG